LPGFPDAEPTKPKTAVQGGDKLRPRWKDSSGAIYEWDYRHGNVEKYNKRGTDEGVFDASGNRVGGPVKGRKVEP